MLKVQMRLECCSPQTTQRRSTLISLTKGTPVTVARTTMMEIRMTAVMGTRVTTVMRLTAKTMVMATKETRTIRIQTMEATVASAASVRKLAPRTALGLLQC